MSRRRSCLKDLVFRYVDDEFALVLEVTPEHTEWVMFGRTREMKTEDGIVLYSQNNSCHGEHGLVFGFKASSLCRPRKSDSEMIKVRLLTKLEQNRYRKNLRRRLRGQITFWE